MMLTSPVIGAAARRNGRDRSDELLGRHVRLGRDPSEVRNRLQHLLEAEQTLHDSCAIILGPQVRGRGDEGVELPGDGQAAAGSRAGAQVLSHRHGGVESSLDARLPVEMTVDAVGSLDDFPELEGFGQLRALHPEGRATHNGADVGRCLCERSDSGRYS